MLIVKKNNNEILFASEHPKLIHNMIGLPFFLIGMANLCILLFEIDVSELKIQILSFPASIIFFLIGLGFIFGKRSLKVNLTEQTMSAWYEVLITIYKKSYDIGHLNHITIKKIRTQTGSGPRNETTDSSTYE